MFGGKSRLYKKERTPGRDPRRAVCRFGPRIEGATGLRPTSSSSLLSSDCCPRRLGRSASSRPGAVRLKASPPLLPVRSTQLVSTDSSDTRSGSFLLVSGMVVVTQRGSVIGCEVLLEVLIEGEGFALQVTPALKVRPLHKKPPQIDNISILLFVQLPALHKNPALFYLFCAKPFNPACLHKKLKPP